LSSTSTPNPPQHHDLYKSIVPNNAINQLTFNIRVGYNVRTPHSHKRLCKTLKATTKNIKISTPI
jgi:hypothetical protein